MGIEKPRESDPESMRNIKDRMEELGDLDTLRSMTEKERKELLKVLKEINKS